MNLIDAYVVEKVGQPFEMYGKWWQKVVYDCWAGRSECNLMFNSKEKAEAVQQGFHFLT